MARKRSQYKPVAYKPKKKTADYKPKTLSTFLWLLGFLGVKIFMLASFYLLSDIFDKDYSMMRWRVITTVSGVAMLALALFEVRKDRDAARPLLLFLWIGMSIMFLMLSIGACAKHLKYGTSSVSPAEAATAVFGVINFVAFLVLFNRKPKGEKKTEIERAKKGAL